VIGFILIIAILMIFLSLWMVYVVPAEGRQQEIEHMNYVRTWFTQYKITADSLWVNEQYNTTLSNSIVLGSQGAATQAGGLFLPVMSPYGSTGSITVTNKAPGGDEETIQIGTDVFPLSRLEFSANNRYWVSQSYYYQMGGVFLRQPTGTVARVAPLVTIDNDENHAQIYITNISIKGVNRVSGQGPFRVDTKLIASDGPHEVNEDIELTLSDGKAAAAWGSYLRELGRVEAIPVGNIVIVSVDSVEYTVLEYQLSFQSVASIV
jgi:hypothetical protein